MVHPKQQELVTQAKKYYPDLSLKDWSVKTGIQITRIFRLFKGSEMSLSEFLRFQELLKNDGNFNKDQDIRNHFQEMYTRLSKCLPIQTMNYLNSQLHFHLENYELLNATSNIIHSKENNK